jgi:uncharacterized DUF497 family protein
MHYRFEWDPAKAEANLRKHGVSFEEARGVFFDVFAVESFDRQHSMEEDRFMIIGTSERGHLLVVAFTPRDYRTIRIISARQARRNEQRQYEEEIRRS